MSLTFYPSAAPSQAWRDTLLVIAVTMLGLMPHRFGLGLYMDDFYVFGLMRDATPATLAGRFSAVMAVEAGIRPVQVAVLTLLYEMFGFWAPGHQAAVALAYAATAGVLHRLALGLGAPRWLGLATACLFGCLPNASADRVWLSAIQITLACLLLFWALLIDLRMLRSRRRPVSFGFVAAGVLAALSLLSYETPLPVVALGPVSLAWLVNRGSWRAALADPLARIMTFRNLAVIAAVAAFKLAADQRGEQIHLLSRPLWRSLGRWLAPWLEEGLSAFNLWRFVVKDLIVYGAALPAVALEAGWRQADLTAWAAAVAVAAAVAWRVRSAGTPPAPAACAWLAVGGLVLALFGYSFFLVKDNIQFTPAGLGNRGALTALPGLALALAGSAGLVAAIVPARLRMLALAVGVGLLAGCGVLVNAAIAGAFAEAAARHRVAVASLERALAGISPSGPVILAGICPYVGPAPAMEPAYEVQLALALLFPGSMAIGDVARPELVAETEGLRSYFAPSSARTYAYGPELIGISLPAGVVTPLRDQPTATAFLAGGANCPRSVSGVGSRLFFWPPASWLRPSGS